MAKRIGKIHVFLGKDADNKNEWHNLWDDEWYWKAVSPNGNIVAIGGEGYKHRTKCWDMSMKYGPANFIPAEDRILGKKTEKFKFPEKVSK